MTDKNRVHKIAEKHIYIRKNSPREKDREQNHVGNGRTIKTRWINVRGRGGMLHQHYGDQSREPKSQTFVIV